MPFPGIRVQLNASAQDAFRFRIILPVAQQGSQGKLRIGIAAAAQIYRPLQSLLCLIPAAQLQVSHTNLVISLVVIRESIRSLLEMIQTALDILLPQLLDALLESVARFPWHLKLVHRDGIAFCSV